MKNLKNIFDQTFTIDFLVKSILITLILLIIYWGTFAYFHSLLLPGGVNYFFAIRIVKGLLVLAGMVMLSILISWIMNNPQKVNWILKTEKTNLSQIIILLIPLTPITQYIISNQEALSFVSKLFVIGFFTLFCGIYIFIIPFFLRRISPMRTTMSLGTAFTFSLLNMASLSHHFSWLKYGSIKVQLPILVLTFIVVWLLLGLNKKGDLLIIVTLFFILNFGVSTFSNSIQEDITQEPTPPFNEEKTEFQKLAEQKNPVMTPNIYLLVYDAYVTNEIMQSYGIDNSEQEAHLESLGFIHYPKTYSIAADTINTMSRVLNASTSFLGDPRRAISGDGVIQNSLKALGYKTYGIFPYDYMFRDIGSTYDVTTPQERRNMSSYFISAIMMGEFRFDLFKIGFDSMTHEEYGEIKQNILNSISDESVFIYSHSKIPNHSQNSGKCLQNEVQLYEERLQKANIEMQQDIEIILQNDPESIIIIAGDHGPYLTKNCTNTKGSYVIDEITRLDIQDRLGTFLAIKWPTEGFESYDEITVLQDIFPVIFAYIYNDDAFLEYKISPQSLYNVSGVTVNDGIIQGGIDDNEPLFIGQ